MAFLSRCLIATTVLLANIAVLADSTFQPEDIFELEYVSQVAIAPNGERIVYVRSSNDIMTDASRKSLWLYEVKTKRHYPLHADKFNYQNPSWSADGNKIAFQSNRSGSKQLYVQWLDENKLALITQVEKSMENVVWSPNGEWLAFTMEVPAPKTDYVKSIYTPKKPKGAKWAKKPAVIEKARYQADGRGMLKPAYSHIFVVPSMGGTARQITAGNYQHQSKLTWSPDSTAIIYSANLDDDWEYQGFETNLYSISISDGKNTQITDRKGAEFSASYSPDGKRLAYLTRKNDPVPYENTQLVVRNLKSDNVSTVSEKLDRGIADYAWQSNSSFIVQYDDRGMRVLSRLSTSGKNQQLTNKLSGSTLGRPYISGSFSLASNGAIAFSLGSAQRPADLGYWYKGKVQQLTKLNDDVLGHRTLGEVQAIQYKSAFDGEPIQGWYITPPNFDPSKKYPLLLEIHGGPHLAYGPHFTAELQRYAADGYVVFYANHRGSTSYGERFAMLLDGKYSSKEDFADHNSGVDAMIAKGFIDENNLFIAGGSAGGIATAYAIGLTNRFNAAVITKPVINWVSKVLTADSYLGQIRNQFPGVPWENLEHYWQRSPISLVGNVTTPSLIMTGEDDRRTPMSESEQFYQALKLKQVDTALVRIPGSPHGIAGKPSRMIAKIEHTLAWLRQYHTKNDD